jgi:hypothetical protein
VYDTRKNMFACQAHLLGGQDVKSCILSFHLPETSGKDLKVYKNRLTKVAEINPEFVACSLPYTLCVR